MFNLAIVMMTSFLFSQEYKLVWQDNFDGTQLDEANNWNIEVNGDGGGNRELQYYLRQNISIGIEPVSQENCLIITGKKENYMGKTCTSGRITTQNKMTFQYGRIDARIKLPKTANGLWPAFWLLGYDIPVMSWPKCGEIDIVEMGNINGINAGTQDRYFNGACHWGFVENGSHPSNVGALTNAYSLQDDFHLFTMVWDTKSIKMYLDQDEYPDVEAYLKMGITADATARDPYYYFNKPFFVLFNLAIGGNFPQLWDIKQITALNNGDTKMYVDYVRVYQTGDPREKFTGVRVTGLTNIKTQNKFRVYPNPITTNLTIKTEKNIAQATIYTLSGQKIMIVSNDKNIDTSDLPGGNYILKIKDEYGLYENHMITKL